MSGRQQIAWLPDGRLHLQDGPIDLIVGADGEAPALGAAYAAAVRRFATLLDDLCAELPALRAAAGPRAPAFEGVVARRMAAAVAPFAAASFITPMAAVAGAVAEEILAAMTGAAPLARVFVNNGGDIALHLSPRQRFRIGLVDRPDRPSLFGRVTLEAADPVRGIATSGWRGRSFSLGIADAVTVLAPSAAMADAAATIIANTVDLPDHPGIGRARAVDLQPDSDLGDRLVTRAVPPLPPAEIDRALRAGLHRAQNLVERRLIVGAALHLQGETRILGPASLVCASPLVSAGENVRDSGDEGRRSLLITCLRLPSSGLPPPSPRWGEGPNRRHGPSNERVPAHA